jgi:hypothetical protein
MLAKPLFDFIPSAVFGPAWRKKRAIRRFNEKGLLLIAVLLIALVAPRGTWGQSFLVDTGAPTGGAVTSMDAAGSTNCSPQPQCSQSFQFWAGQFTLTHAASISEADIWMGPIFIGGALTVNIYADGGGIPGTAIYAQTYNVPPSSFRGWFPFVFSSPLPNLTAGTYWVGFEPVKFTGTNGAGFSTNLDGGAPNPLAHYAVWNDASVLGPFGNGYRAFKTGVFSLGMRIAGTNFADLAFGTSGRGTMSGSTFGFAFSADNTAGGVGQASIFTGAGDSPGGLTFVRASLTPNSLSTGAWSGTSICIPSFGGCTEGTGSGRGVAFRTFTNTSNASIMVQANALLHGGITNIGGSPGSAIGRVYLLDPTQFSNTVNGAPDAARFLLNSLPVDQDLTSLFEAGTVLSSSLPQQRLTGPIDPAIAVPLTTGLVTVGPGQSITVMFDVTTITPQGNTVDFFSTLAPASPFFTDANGNPVTGLLAVGPAVAVAPAATALTLSPASATNAAGGSQTLTVTATDVNSAPVVGAIVYFTIASGGPNAGSPVPAVTDVNGQATFTYTDVGGAGSDSIQAKIDALASNAAQISWTSPGALDHITISPANASIATGGTQAYTAQGFDVFNTSIGDVTATTTFSISPDGSCTGTACTATIASLHTVTGNDNGKTTQATLQVSGQTDTTPPQIACAGPDMLWHASDVSLVCTASDSGSGLTHLSDSNFSLSTGVPVGTETASASTGIRVVCDVAGNCANAGPIGGIKVDKKAPAINIVAPLNGGIYPANQKVNAAYGCIDLGSGLATCMGTASNGASIDTRPNGTSTTKTFTVTSMDAVNNAASQSVSYTVSCHYVTLGIAPSSAARGGRITVTAGVMSCIPATQTIGEHFTLTGPLGPSCSRTSTVMFTTPLFSLPGGTSKTVSFASIIPKNACAGTYTTTATTLVGGVAIDSTSATLTVQ